MAISDTSITSVELTNTFEAWRSKTNQLITVLNQQSDDDPVTSLLSADSDGGLTINTISADILTGASVTGSALTFSGGSIDFTGATTTDIGTVEKYALVETVGATVTGASPDSKIERAQINECEINLNGLNLNSNGASTITLTGATVADLGTVQQVTIDEGTVNDVNVNITASDKIITVSSPGPHIFTGATFANGTFNNTYTIGGFTHSANISVNTSSVLVMNTGPILGSDVGTSNVAIGNFPEYTTSPTLATSSKGRLHIRTDFAAGSTTATAIEAVADDMLIEGNTTVGMTLLANNAANSIIAFGDPDNADVGGVLYDHATDSLHIVTDAANTVVFGNEYGGYMQVAGGDTLGTQRGKLHVNVGSTDGTTGIFVETGDVDQRGVLINAISTTTANVFEVNTYATTSGHVLAIHHGLGTGTSHAMSGSMLAVTDNNSSTDARAVVNILQDATGATGSIGLKVKTDGGTGISVIQWQNTNPALNVTATNAHSTSVGIFKSSHVDSTGATLYVHGMSSTGATQILQVANSSGDIFSTLANGVLTCGGPLLSANSTVNVNCRLPVKDTSGTVVNQV